MTTATPNNGGRDCSGCCVRLVIPDTKKPAPVVDTCTMCGGIANIQCAAGWTCMDDTRDNCDPQQGWPGLQRVLCASGDP